MISDGEKRTGSRQLLTSGLFFLLLLCILLWGGQYPGAPEGIPDCIDLLRYQPDFVRRRIFVIAALHELFVDNLNWLTSAEFADGIAIGRILPDRYLLQRQPIGYKVAGITGALLAAALAMFTPPAVLTVLLSRL